MSYSGSQPADRPIYSASVADARDPYHNRVVSWDAGLAGNSGFGSREHGLENMTAPVAFAKESEMDRIPLAIVGAGGMGGRHLRALGALYELSLIHI